MGGQATQAPTKATGCSKDVENFWRANVLSSILIQNFQNLMFLLKRTWKIWIFILTKFQKFGSSLRKLENMFFLLKNLSRLSGQLSSGLHILSYRLRLPDKTGSSRCTTTDTQLLANLSNQSTLCPDVIKAFSLLAMPIYNTSHWFVQVNDQSEWIKYISPDLEWSKCCGQSHIWIIEK